MKMKAIETTYNGWRFRSRLEARWAVCFDALGISYEYESATQDLGNQGWYLPDFYLPDLEMYVEVKPKPISWEVFRKLLASVVNTKEPMLLLIGPPDYRPYYALVPRGDMVEIEEYTVTSPAAVATMRHVRFEFGETPTQEKVREMARNFKDTEITPRLASFNDDVDFKLEGDKFKVIT